MRLIQITKQCIGLAYNEDREVVSKFLFEPGDILYHNSYYVYYEDEDSVHWNEQFPTVNPRFNFSWSIYNYRLPPETFEYLYGKDYEDLTDFGYYEEDINEGTRIRYVDVTYEEGVKLLLSTYLKFKRKNKI